jgi:hypothetical protein
VNVPPTVPVVVLNATPTVGAAGKLASQLRSDRVSVAETGNVTETRSPGIAILYAPGERAQAARLVRLLAARSPSLAPIDPASAAAAGSGAKLVVLIS